MRIPNVISACIVFLAATAAAEAKTDFVITFDDPIVSEVGQIVYIPAIRPDVTFSDLVDIGFFPYGPFTDQSLVDGPGLEGGVRDRGALQYDPPEVLVEFGFVGSLGFTFAVNSNASFVSDAVHFSVYTSSGLLIRENWESAQSYGGAFPEGRISADFFGHEARFAIINFRDDPNPGEEFNRYIIDNFYSVPEPAIWFQLIAGFGLVGTALRRWSVALS